MQMKNELGQPLGYCRSCTRVRWLAVVEPADPRAYTPCGVCRTCDREGKAAAASAQSTDIQDFSTEG